MKSFLAIIACAAILASCKKGDKTAPTHVADPCASNTGSANFTFTSHHYGTQESYNLEKCEFALTFKDHHWKGNLFKSTVMAQKDDMSMGVSFDKWFTLGGVGDTMHVGKGQLVLRTGIDDEDIYDYASNGRDGSYFIANSLTDTTISGTFHVHMSRRRAFSNGDNMDMKDSSLIEGTFTNIKILRQHL